jgi:hypothetical protein
MEAMIQAATTDCYNESEEVSAPGWFTRIEESLATPFETQVLGAAVTVRRIALNDAGQIVAVCSRGRNRRTLPILDLPLPRAGLAEKTNSRSRSGDPIRSNAS